MLSISPNSPPPALLDLSTDILQLIIKHLSIEDARNFRTCSRRAEEVSSPRALSHQVLRLSTSGCLLDKKIERLVHRQPDRLSWIQQLVVKRYRPGVQRIDPLVTVLSAAQDLRELSLDALEENLGLCDAIATLPCLATLILEDTGPRTSTWILDNGSLSSNFSCLTSFSLTVLDFSDWQPNTPVRRLATLRSLSVDILRGPPELLVQFAPRLTSLRFALAYGAVVSSPAVSNVGWTTLTSIGGPVDDIHHLLPLVHTIVHTVVFTQDICTESVARCIEPTLQRLKPCCLQIKGQFKSALVFPRLARASPRLFYLQFNLSDCTDWVTEFDTAAKDLTSLICIDIAVDCTKTFYTNKLHYLTYRLPTLKFLLTGTPANKTTPAEPLPSESFATYGLVFSKAEVSTVDRTTGRTIAVLTHRTAERVRRAYREVTFEARSDVYEHLLPGSMISDCTNKGSIHDIFVGKREFTLL